MIKYFTIEDLLKHYLQKKFHILKHSLSIPAPCGHGNIEPHTILGEYEFDDNSKNFVKSVESMLSVYADYNI